MPNTIGKNQDEGGRQSKLIGTARRQTGKCHLVRNLVMRNEQIGPRLSAMRSGVLARVLTLECRSFCLGEYVRIIHLIGAFRFAEKFASVDFGDKIWFI